MTLCRAALAQQRSSTSCSIKMPLVRDALASFAQWRPFWPHMKPCLLLSERHGLLGDSQSSERSGLMAEARLYLKSMMLSKFAQFAERDPCILLQSAAPQEYTRRTWLEQPFLRPFFDNWPMSNSGLCTLITKVGTALYCLTFADAVNLLTQIKVPKWWQMTA